MIAITIVVMPQCQSKSWTIMVMVMDNGVPKQSRFTTVLADISADGRRPTEISSSTSTPTLPCLVESSLFGTDSDSSFNDESENSPSLSTALQRIQHLEVQLQQQTTFKLSNSTTNVKRSNPKSLPFPMFCWIMKNVSTMPTKEITK